MLSSKWIWVVVIIVLAGGAFLYIQSMQNKSSNTVPVVALSPSPVSQDASSTPSAAIQGQNAVTVNADGFSPQNITIKVGETVTWTNSDSSDHTVNSAPHPMHTDYVPLNLGTIKPEETKSLSFPKAGTFKYHDHLNPSLFGSITVQ